MKNTFKFIDLVLVLGTKKLQYIQAKNKSDEGGTMEAYYDGKIVAINEIFELLEKVTNE